MLKNIQRKFLEIQTFWIFRIYDSPPVVRADFRILKPENHEEPLYEFILFSKIVLGGWEGPL